MTTKKNKQRQKLIPDGMTTKEQTTTKPEWMMNANLSEEFAS